MDKIITIGRSSSSDIVLNHPAISRDHAQITLVDREKQLFHIEDLGSSNGIFKNGEKIKEADFDFQKDRISIAYIDLKPSHFLPYFFDDSTRILSADEGLSSRLDSEEKQKSIERVEAVKRSKRGDNKFISSFFEGILDRKDSDGLRSQYLIITFLLGVGASWVYYSGLSPSTSYSLAGYALLLVLLGNMAFSLVESSRRISYGSRQQQLALALWQEKVGVTTIRRVENERSEHAWDGYRKFEINRKIKECDDIYSFYLTPHDKKQLPSFRPGQHLTFRLNIPGQSKPVVRCYSLSDSSMKMDEYRITIKKLTDGLCSNYFHDHLDEGDILDVKAPSGHFYLDVTKETPIVLIAGGIGVTPLLSMVNTLSDLNSHREALIIYGARNSRELAQAEHLEQVVSEHPNIQLHNCFSKPLDTDLINHYRHPTRITMDFLKTLLNSNNYEFYVCGPGAMMNDLTTGLESWGVPPEHIHHEGFGPSSVRKISTIHATREKADAQISIHFAKSGKTCVWSQDAGSLLNLARDNGIEIESGCEAGNCGTCLVAIREGDIEYMSEPGDMPEKGSCLACIALPKSDLSLDA